MGGSLTSDLLLFFGSLVITTGLMIAVHRRLTVERRVQYNEVAGFIFAVIAAVYAVTTGLVAVTAWESLSTSRTTVQSETNSLMDLYLVAAGLPQPAHTQIQTTTRQYAQTVLTSEWSLMTHHHQASPAAWTELDSMSAVLASVHPADEGSQAALDRCLDRLQEVYDARRDRLAAAQEGLPGYLWIILITGGVVTIGFTFLFGLSTDFAQAVMVLCLTSTIALLLLLTHEMALPFTGVLRVRPDMFQEALDRFGGT
ncbi:DUF4239 domain-containing protein [Kitasatospora sp. GAS204B]|uniref:bestrophin-like domain n=1 Tax=unclassified Kitasatospora TaxID=2633591 RepID=UPI002473E859|nr:DUF4239 domain-containing protein [Kitasatospora sp. GAS204B]MDH6119839.1 hypothetical protein [Kitasatospora sp. GAS204B]